MSYRAGCKRLPSGEYCAALVKQVLQYTYYYYESQKWHQARAQNAGG